MIIKVHNLFNRTLRGTLGYMIDPECVQVNKLLVTYRIKIVKKHQWRYLLTHTGVILRSSRDITKLL